MNIRDKTYYYFIGIGGIGMSALARYFKFFGKEVCGYDKTPSKLTAQLTEEGIDVHYTDLGNNIPFTLTPGNTLVIYTPAVPDNLGEYQYFKNHGFTILKRSEVLGEITNGTFGIAVAGTHGKTTTSSLLGHILYYAGEEVTAFMGGVLLDYESNFLIRGNHYTVAEADEFDRSFLRLSPRVAIITAMEPDHLDIYGTAEEFKKAFVEFAAKVSDKRFVRKGLPIPDADTYGVESGADYDAVNLRVEDGVYHFDLKTPEFLLKDFILKLPGRHNVENTAAAVAVALYLGVEPKLIREAVENFKGVERRFNRWDIGEKIYIDDYAHHPSELKALISSLREIFPGKKILGVFQPHLYSRTRDFMEEFVEVLKGFDDLLLVDIYPARELPIEGITSAALAEKIDTKHKEVCTLKETPDKICEKEFDVLVTAGAGDIGTLVETIKNRLYEMV